MKRRVLIIVPFDPIYPPMNGGMQRCFHIIHQLAIHFELTIIMNQKKDEFLLAAKQFPAIKNVEIYSTQDAAKTNDIFNVFPEKLQKALRYRWYKKKWNESADGNFLKYYSVVKQLLKQQKFDVIILENIATLNAISLIRKYDRRVKIIYNAHNVDTNLAAAFLEKKEIRKERYISVRNSESFLHKNVDAILCCSKKDRDDFDLLNNGKLLISIVPNGVNISYKLSDEAVNSDHPGHILFCGFLETLPNQEGLLWFWKSVWPQIKIQFPSLKLLIVGSGKLPSSMNELLSDSSVIFTGPVNEVKEYYNKSSISIVPLKTGSGTRLKILEAMSYGVPVVSTAKGAEGIDYTNGFNILIADSKEAFSNNIIRLLKNKEERISIQQHARQLAEIKYDWNIIGKGLAGFINTNFQVNE